MIYSLSLAWLVRTVTRYWYDVFFLLSCVMTRSYFMFVLWRLLLIVIIVTRCFHSHCHDVFLLSSFQIEYFRIGTKDLTPNKSLYDIMVTYGLKTKGLSKPPYIPLFSKALLLRRGKRGGHLRGALRFHDDGDIDHCHVVLLCRWNQPRKTERLPPVRTKKAVSRRVWQRVEWLVVVFFPADNDKVVRGH